MVKVGQVYRVPLERWVRVPGMPPYNCRIVKVVKVHEDGTFDIHTLDDPPLFSKWGGCSVGRIQRERWQPLEGEQLTMWQIEGFLQKRK